MYQVNHRFKSVELQCQGRSVVDKSGNVILDISFPEKEGIRSRKIISRSRARATGKYPSWKMRRMMHWESHNELNAFRLLDANPSVIAFHEQPLTINYSLNGELHRHYPDLLVETFSAPEIWEIKPSAEAADLFIVERTKFLTQHLPQLGFSYRMVIGEDLSKEPRLSNLLSFLKYGRADLNELDREFIRQILLHKKSITWGSVLNGELEPRGKQKICRLFLEGKLICNFDEKLNVNTRFFSQNFDVQKASL